MFFWVELLFPVVGGVRIRPHDQPPPAVGSKTLSEPMSAADDDDEFITFSKFGPFSSLIQ